MLQDLLTMPNDDDFESSSVKPVQSVRVQLAHPFQTRGLGLAPFSCVHASVGEDDCAYCGRPIKNLFHIRSDDGKTFVVGSECVARTSANVRGFDIVRRKFDAAARAARKVAQLTQAATAWRELHKDEAAWIKAESDRGFQFARSMEKALAQWGSLTDGQINAIRRCIAGAADRARTQQAQIKADQTRIESAQIIDIRRIEKAFAAASAKGLGKPKISLADFTFAPAKPNSRNPGAIYVTGGREWGSVYYGMVKDGKFIRSRECPKEIEAAILEACNDPEEAANKYGRMTGRCAVCARLLTAKESVDRAIGPICAENFGW